MRVLITGIAGFAGSRLAEHLLTLPDTEIHGVIHRSDLRIRHIQSHLHLHRGDLRDPTWVHALVQQVRPERVCHLAAWSDVGGSWAHPWTAYELNILCQLNLMEALQRHVPVCRVLVITSNEVYGRVHPEEIPIHEETRFRPNSPYGVSKIAQDMMALQYWNSHRLPTIRARSFNHLGPGQAPDFVASAFARQIAAIEVGLQEPVLRVGNLDAVRDFTDVRDVVRAYWLLLERGQAGQVYNVGSGVGRSIRWLLETLLTMTEVPIAVEQDPSRMRPSDVPISVCDNRRLVETTGWQPAYSLEQSLRDVLDYWRAEIRGERVLH